jgi:hypothetical protein
MLSSVFGKRLLPFVHSELMASGQKAVTLFYPDFFSPSTDLHQADSSRQRPSLTSSGR